MQHQCKAPKAFKIDLKPEIIEKAWTLKQNVRNRQGQVNHPFNEWTNPGIQRVDRTQKFGQQNPKRHHDEQKEKKLAISAAGGDGLQNWTDPQGIYIGAASEYQQADGQSL